MSIENEKVSEEAWENIEICCQTLCDKEKVMEYISHLEEENRSLRAALETAKRA